MSRLTYYRVKNAMLFSSLVSNGIGVAVVQFLTQRSASALSPEILRLLKTLTIFLPLSYFRGFDPAL
jgi:hypothetical protein